MLKRPHYIALGIVILLTLVVLKLPNRTAAQLKLAMGGLFLPIFSFFGSAQQLAENTGNAVVPRKELLRQLEQLQNENQELRIRSMQYEAMAQENARLRQYFGWQKQALWKLKLARVVARDPANWWRNLQIDLGSRDDLKPDLPVVTAEGLVGKVVNVGLVWATTCLPLHFPLRLHLARRSAKRTEGLPSHKGEVNRDGEV